MKNIKKSYIVVFILLVLAVICFSTSYAIFMNVNEQSGKLNIVVGDLAYKIESKDLENNKITVAANTNKELEIKLTSLNEINSKYELYYLLEEPNENIEIGYSVDTKDSVLGTINANETKEINIVIRNNDTNTETIEFSVAGGLANNELVLNDGNSLNKELNTILTFAETIKRNNTLITSKPTLTTSSNNTTDASGLYESTATNDGKSTYYFRGNVENNYVSFAGQTWRIVRINEDGTVRLIMQNGINNNTTYAFAGSDSKTYMYYTNSTVKGQLESWYQTNIASNENYLSKVATGDYFCEQAKVARDADRASNSGTAMTVYTSYTPNFKCQTDANQKGIVNTSIGLINYDEVIFAGGYYPKVNTSYYLYDGGYYWTMSPAGYHSSGYTGVWTIHLVDGMSVSRAAYGDYYRLRPVINLKADTVVVGSGTNEDPYRIIAQTSDTLTVGTSVTAIDGSRWHVLENSNENTETVVLLSDYNLNSDGTYNTECGRDIDGNYACSGRAFDPNNTITYDETDSNNIAYFIKNTYAPKVTAALPGTTDVKIPSVWQIAAVDNKDVIFNGSAFTKITSTWLTTTDYWTSDSDGNYIYNVYGTDSRFNYAVSYNAGFGTKPVITTPKSNLIFE